MTIELRSVYAESEGRAGHPTQRILLNGQEVTSVRLLDDGRDGDLAAGDSVFTSPELVPNQEEYTPVATFYPLRIAGVAWEFGDTAVAVTFGGDERLRAEIYDADRAALPTPPVMELGADARRTSHVVSLMIPNPTRLGTEWAYDSTAVRRYYEVVGYDPDFLVVYLPSVRAANSIAAFYLGVSNRVQGIGSDTVLNEASRYGSPGQLLGVASVLGTPDPYGTGLLVHELGHRWFAYVDASLLVSNGAHWTSGLARSYSGFSDGRYNDVELYLMGLLPADSVLPPVISVHGTTIQDLIDAQGLRIPAWPETKHEFTMATVVAFPRLLTDAELALFDFTVAEFGAETPSPLWGDTIPVTFRSATGGRATLTTRIPDGPGG